MRSDFSDPRRGQSTFARETSTGSRREAEAIQPRIDKRGKGPKAIDLQPAG